MEMIFGLVVAVLVFTLMDGVPRRLEHRSAEARKRNAHQALLRRLGEDPLIGMGVGQMRRILRRCDEESGSCRMVVRKA